MREPLSYTDNNVYGTGNNSVESSSFGRDLASQLADSGRHQL